MLRKLIETTSWFLARALQLCLLTLVMLSGAYVLYLNGMEFIPFRYTGF